MAAGSGAGEDSSCWICGFWKQLVAQQASEVHLHKPPATQPILPADSKAVHPRRQPVSASTSGMPAYQQQTRDATAGQQRAEVVREPAAPTSDCMGCRLTGLALGIGGGGYLASRLLEEPPPRGAHRYTLVAASIGVFALGLGRALGF